ncbi:seryl-tRNA synthetase [Linnemannia zychae]|nr:seryl-tRNA synthetase [Linnemannia zychae]
MQFIRTAGSLKSLRPILSSPHLQSSFLRITGSSSSCCRVKNLAIQTSRRSFANSRLSNSSATTVTTPITQVPALILKPHINFKALQHPEAAAAMTKNIRDRNLPDSISVAAVNTLYTEVNERTQTLDKARAERNRTAAEMKTLFSDQGGNGKKVKKAGASPGVESTATTGVASEQAELSKEDKERKRQELIERGRVLKEEIHAQEAELAVLETQLYEQAILIPNTTHPETPIGPESEARLVRIQGVPRLNPGVKAFAHPGVDSETAGEEGRALLGNVSEYPLLDHVSLAKHLDLVDFEAATAATGARWYYLKNEAALLELALIQFATQRAVKAGYMPVITPDVVRPEVVQACGFQPRDEASQTYWVTTAAPGSAKAMSPEGGAHHSALCLVATAEIALGGMNMNKVIEESQLPIKMAGFGRAFRAEAGSRGAEVKGLYRVHQFSKVELFALSKADPGESDLILEDIRKFQEDIFEELGLCYRVLDMPTEELGASAYKKYDIEAWMPGRNGWGEISSTSNCTDYQSRRLNIRYRTNKIRSPSSSPKQPYHQQTETGSSVSSTLVSSGSGSNTVVSTEFVHTLNGTAMAIPRIIVALLETYQQPDGSVRLPECLWPYMAGVTEILPK